MPLARLPDSQNTWQISPVLASEAKVYASRFAQGPYAVDQCCPASPRAHLDRADRMILLRTGLLSGASSTAGKVTFPAESRCKSPSNRLASSSVTIRCSRSTSVAIATPARLNYKVTIRARVPAVWILGILGVLRVIASKYHNKNIGRHVAWSRRHTHPVSLQGWHNHGLIL